MASKREVRGYSDRPVPDAVVRRILEAGRIAGSSRNRQPWRFLVAGIRVCASGLPRRSSRRATCGTRR
ncbi:MAG: nitroreductase family protein [Solirubrobacteraceae bacterium]